MSRQMSRIARPISSLTRGILTGVALAGAAFTGLGATAAQAELSNGYISINYRLDGLCAAGPNANDTTGRVNVSFGATSSFSGEYLNLAQWEEDLTSTANRLGLQASSDGETLSASPNVNFPASNMIGTDVWFGLYGDFRDAGTGRALTESPLEPGTTPLGTFGTFHYTSLDMASDPDCSYTKAPMTVSGNGAVISNGDSTPSTLDRTDFGSVDIASGPVSRTYELEPGASGEPSITSVTLGGGSSIAFSLTSGFSGTLSPGSSQDVTVAFNPTTAGEHTATLVVTGPNIQTYSFTIKGTATGEPNLQVFGASNGTTLIPNGDTNPTTAKSTDYGDVGFGGSGSSHYFLLYNPGGAALTVNDVSITSGQGFAVSSAPATTIGAGGSSGMNIRFTPPGTDDYTATVTITTNAPASPYTFRITGSGVDTQPPTAILSDFTGPASDDTFSSQVTFSEPVTGFTTDDLTLTNATAQITSQSTSTYTVVLTPLSAGDIGYSIKSGSVQDLAGLSNTSAFGPVISAFSGTPAIEIVGNNQPIPPGSTTPSTLNYTDFGTFEHPAAASRTYSIRNTGSARLTVSDIRDGSSAFTPSRGSVSVEPGEFALLTIFYAPTAPGTHQTTIQMSTNVPTQSTYNFAVKAVSQDTTAPQTTLAPLSGPVNGVYTTTISFSEDVNPFQGNELTLINATASVSGTGDSYTVTLTPQGSGTVSVAAPLGLTEDVYGNESTAAGPVTAEFDATPPSATLSALSGPVNGLYSATLTFSEAVTGLTESDLTLVNASATLSGSADSYTLEITPDGDGLLSVTVPADAAEDAAGNGNTASVTREATYDSTGPSATLSALSGPVNGLYSATLTFSEAVTGLTESDLTLVNASAALSGSADSYTLEITPDGDGLLSVTVPADAAEDAAGNGNTASVTREATYDSTGPSATLSALSGPVNGLYSATLTFSEAVTGLTESDLTLVNASATLSGSADSYTLEITPDGDGLLSVTVPADAAEDAAGNGNTASVTRQATYDGTAPTFTLGDLQGPQNGDEFTSRVTFSEPVTGFALVDLSLTNATATLTQVSATTWDIVLTALAAGEVGYEIGAGAVEDTAGNANTATGAKSISFSGQPAIELRGSGTLIPPGSSSPATGNGTDMGVHEYPTGTTYQFTLSNPGTATLELSQISDDDDNFSASADTMSIAPGSSTTLTVTFEPVETGSHSATIEIASNAYGQASYSFVVSAVSQDTTAPTTTIAPLSGPTNGVYTTTISFSEEVAGFTGADLTLVNATATVSGSGDSYTVTLTPAGQGSVSIAAPAGMTQDGAGNPSTADGPVSAIFDTVAPLVVLSELSGPTNGIYSVTLEFSEPVTGLTAQGLNVVNATPSLTGSGTTYVVKLSPLADGLVSLSVAANAAQDAAGNGNVASETKQAIHDTTGPTADLSTLSGPDNGVYTATLTFSEPVTGMSAGDLTLVNATATVSGQGSDYMLEITPSGPGFFSVQVQADAAQDGAQNGNTASLTRSATYDGIAPTVLLGTSAESYMGQESISVTVTFSEPVTGLETSDVQISGGTVTGLTGSDADYVLSVQSSGTGDLSLYLPEGAAQDGAGNLSEASNLLSLANTVVAESREAIARFLIQRNAALLASQPDLTDLLGGGAPRSFALQAQPGMLSFSFDGPLSRSVWMELEARRSTTDGTRADYLFGVIGAHAFASERLVAGVMLQFDHMATAAADPSIEGSGWLAGPYLAGQIADQRLRYEARLLYGQTRNRISAGGSPEARFSTERWLAQARLEGSIERGIYTLEPSLGIAHVKDRQEAYQDGFGNPVAGQSAALTEVDLGLDVSWPVATSGGDLELTGGVAVVWGKTHTEDAPTTGDYDVDGLRGRLTFGLSGQTHDGLNYVLGLDYDGLGSAHESFGAKLEVSLRF